MAEWSKAPDSRWESFLVTGVFWSPIGGEGSNPSSDTTFALKKSSSLSIPKNSPNGERKTHEQWLIVW